MSPPFLGREPDFRKVTLLKFGEIASFWAAYRLTAHGVTMKESASLFLGYLAFVATVFLLVAVFWFGRRGA